MTKEFTTLILISGVLLASVILSWFKCDWAWFSRGGALVVLIGLLVQSRKVITTRKNYALPFWENKDTRRAIRNGFIALCIGTIIWGFGDLVSGLTFACLK